MRLNKKDGLNIVPFIDIMLVLLAIVLSISSFIAQGQIPVNLPNAKSAKQESEDEKVVITIDKNNKFYVDDVDVDLVNLRNKINEIDSSTLIQLKSDSNSTFESFIKVIDILKEKKHEKFSISTKIE